MIAFAGTIRYVAASCVLSIFPLFSFAQNYVQTNLVSDIPQPANANGTLVTVDQHLKNAWGLARGASTPWWANNAGTGTSTLYTGGGGTVPLVVTIPNARGASRPSSPTGMVFNGTADFALAAGNPAVFIFATANGTISGWGPPATPVSAGQSTALNEVDESQNGAVFMGLTWIESEGSHFLLAANFGQNRIEKFDKNFKRVHLDEDAFFVALRLAYVTKNAADDDCGEDCGWVDVFTAKGRLIQRLEHGPFLRAPWGVALAPQDFGFFSHDLLIGNRFGGTIAAFNVVSGKFLGNLLDAKSSPIAIDGLWGLEFDNRGNNEAGTTTNPSSGPALFFAAGINGYADGLFGTLTPTTPQLNAEDHQ